MFRAFLQEREAEIRPENLDLAAFMVIEAVEAITHAAVLDRPEYLEVEDFVEEISTLEQFSKRMVPWLRRAGC